MVKYVELFCVLCCPKIDSNETGQENKQIYITSRVKQNAEIQKRQN